MDGNTLYPAKYAHEFSLKAATDKFISRIWDAICIAAADGKFSCTIQGPKSAEVENRVLAELAAKGYMTTAEYGSLTVSW